MEKKNYGSLMFGIFFIILGIIMLLKMTGIISFSIWHGFFTYWPAFLIIIGVCLIFKQRWCAFLFLLILIVIGSISIMDNFHVNPKAPKNTVQKIEVDSNIQTMSLNIDFGMGNLKINDRENNDQQGIKLDKNYILFENKISTIDSNEPELTQKIDGNNIDIYTSRNCEGEIFFGNNQNDWSIILSSDVIIEKLELDYGATDAQIDLTDLFVDQLKIGNGASSTEIIFADYPTNAVIDVGASSVELVFPKNSQVMIEYDSGLSSIEFNDMVYRDGSYYSVNFDSERDYIKIKINAGLSDIKSHFRK